MTEEEEKRITHTISHRRKQLAKCRYKDAERSLWLMEQIQNLQRLLELKKVPIICPKK